MSSRRGVQRFTSAEAMQAAAPQPAEPDIERFFRHCARYRALSPRTFPRGVFKFKSVEDAQRAREAHGGR